MAPRTTRSGSGDAARVRTPAGVSDGHRPARWARRSPRCAAERRRGATRRSEPRRRWRW